jgi:hypothetical protein
MKHGRKTYNGEVRRRGASKDRQTLTWRLSLNRMILHSRVGADGVLHLTVPMGKDDADREVQVTIQPAEPKHGMASEQEEWWQFVSETAGAWQGDLERPEQGAYEQRAELP